MWGVNWLSRRRIRPIWRSRTGRAAVLVLVAALAAASVALSIRSGWAGRQVAALGDEALALTRDAGFAVRDVVLIGHERTPREVLRRTLGVVEGVPILGVDAEAARLRVEQLPWVESAEVERVLPHAVAVRVVERRPLALWQHDGGFSVVDDTGRIVAGAEPMRFTWLPVVKGDGAPEGAPELLGMLRRGAGIADRITGLLFVSGRRWNVYLDHSVEIKLPEEGASEAWARLAEIARTRRLFDGSIVGIDLRFGDRMVLRPAVAEVRERG